MPLPNDSAMWLHVEAEISELDPALTIGYAIYSESHELLYWSYQTDTPPDQWPPITAGKVVLRGLIPPRFFNEGTYTIELVGGLHHRKWLFEPQVNSPSILLSLRGPVERFPALAGKTPWPAGSSPTLGFIVMRGRQFLQRLRGIMVNDHRRVSYAQCGEDLILQFLFGLLGIARPTYLDIGAHHPTSLSNTYLFYKGGSRGVCVEPNPELHAVIKRQRPNDICLNAGVGIGDAGPLRFYILDDPTMSTFSEETVRGQIARGLRVTMEVEVTLEPVNGIVEKYLLPHPEFCLPRHRGS